MSTAAPVGRRAQILIAAARLFAERGYHDVRVEEIAVEAGVGKGTVYEYFRSKLDLLQHLVVEALRTYLGILDAITVDHRPAVIRLQAVFEQSFTFVEANRPLARLLLDQGHALIEELRQAFLEGRNRILEDLGRIVAEGRATGEFRAVDPLLAARMLMALLNSSMFGRLIESETDCSMAAAEPRMTVEAEALLDLVLQGLAARP